VAQYTVEKLNQLGAVPVTLSDSDGFIHDSKGISPEKLAFVLDLKNVRRGRISEYAKKFGCEYVAGKRPWVVKCDAAFPSATQNEISGDDAATLIKNGCKVIAEGANMPSTPEAIEQFLEAKVLYGPGKAANAGGVATSGLEMSQNSARLSWTSAEVDARLKGIMQSIPRGRLQDRQGLRPAHQLRDGREHRRLRQGRRLDARSGCGLADVLFTGLGRAGGIPPVAAKAVS